MYTPTLARFTARDPLPENGAPVLGGAAAYTQPYAYARNNPININDPSGELPWGIIIELGILALWYGNYCGPASTLPGPGPVDGLDQCCQAHDNCYAGFGLKWWNALPRCSTPLSLRCDANLCACAQRFNCGAVPIWRRPHCYTYRQEVITYFC